MRLERRSGQWWRVSFSGFWRQSFFGKTREAMTVDVGDSSKELKEEISKMSLKRRSSCPMLKRRTGQEELQFFAD
jgi:hypothetical protein